jgi:hypothetical protein
MSAKSGLSWVSAAWLRETSLRRAEHEQRIFPTLRQAMKAYGKTHRGELPPDEE